MQNLSSPNFNPPLWKHQAIALKRAVYAFEQLNQEDLLLKIVTGGGKTVIIGAMMAYLRIMHNINQFLLLVPNTIVRDRLVDAFDPNPNNRDYTFRAFGSSGNRVGDLRGKHGWKPHGYWLSGVSQGA